MSADGNMSAAEKAQRSMVDRRMKELGPDHISTIKGMMKLALTLKRSRDNEVLQECKTMMHQCIKAFEEKEGPNSENCLMVMNGLAQVLARLGRYDESEAMFRRTLAGREETLGKHHPDTMITVNNLALLLEETGGESKEGSEADQMHRRALPFTPRDMLVVE